MSDVREALVALLNHPDHAPMSTHDPRDGSCRSCPWPLHEMPPEDIADAILAEFDVTPRGEGDDAEWEYGLVNPDALPGQYGRDDTAHLVGPRDHIALQHRRGHPAIQFVRRRKAGKWEVVSDE